MDDLPQVLRWLRRFRETRVSPPARPTARHVGGGEYELSVPLDPAKWFPDIPEAADLEFGRLELRMGGSEHWELWAVQTSGRDASRPLKVMFTTSPTHADAVEELLGYQLVTADPSLVFFSPRQP